ncbi:galactose-binding domain-like protein [Echria macrotheca]|uniref:Galactose-binding domain-like protein n=1 Tax=Echria macrotheca TaxID=438768 RepID=A0AAJ0FEF4_9PEZI|nr:galactose-binding domain-like protein [Echria macrotheca]
MSKRSLLTTLVDQLFGYLNKLPPETTSYTTTSLRIPITTSSHESLALSATLYRPLSLPSTRPVIDSVPLLPAVESHFGGEMPWWLRKMLGTNPYSASLSPEDSNFWKGFDLSTALDRANIPILLTTGWFDPVMPAVLDQYSRLLENNSPASLTIGPWTHLGASGRNSLAEVFSWISSHLTNREEKERTAPVRVYITGAEKWAHLSSWPPSPTHHQELFLSSGSLLAGSVPTTAAPESSSTFKFNPLDPTPAIATPQLFDNTYTKQPNTALSARPDILTFTSAPLPSDLQIIGRPRVDLFHTSSSSHFDILLILNEVDATTSQSYPITEKFIRFSSDNKAPLSLDLHDCAHMFRKGNYIQLLVGGGSHPRYMRNFGTEEAKENPAEATMMRSVTHTVSHNAQAPSRILLPVVTDLDKSKQDV